MHIQTGTQTVSSLGHTHAHMHPPPKSTPVLLQEYMFCMGTQRQVHPLPPPHSVYGTHTLAMHGAQYGEDG